MRLIGVTLPSSRSLARYTMRTLPRLNSPKPEVRDESGWSRPMRTSTRSFPGYPCSPSALTYLKIAAVATSDTIVSSSMSLNNSTSPGPGGTGICSQGFSSNPTWPPCNETSGVSLGKGAKDVWMSGEREEETESSFAGSRLVYRPMMVLVYLMCLCECGDSGPMTRS